MLVRTSKEVIGSEDDYGSKLDSFDNYQTIILIN